MAKHVILMSHVKTHLEVSHAANAKQATTAMVMVAVFSTTVPLGQPYPTQTALTPIHALAWLEITVCSSATLAMLVVHQSTYVVRTSTLLVAYA